MAYEIRRQRLRRMAWAITLVVIVTLPFAAYQIYRILRP